MESAPVKVTTVSPAATSWLGVNVAAIVALITIGGGFALLFVRPELKTEAIAVMTFVLGFYFGSAPAVHDLLTKGGSNSETTTTK